MEVDNAQASPVIPPQQPVPVKEAATATKSVETEPPTIINDGQPAQQAVDGSAMLAEELPDGSFKSSANPASTPRVSRISDAELEALYANLEALKKDLNQARQNERRHAALASNLVAMERERDRYRAVSWLFLHRLVASSIMLINTVAMATYRPSSALRIRTKCSMMSLHRVER